MTKKGCWILKIARYRCRNVETYGIINNQTAVSIPTLAKHLKKEVPLKLEEFIADGIIYLGDVERKGDLIRALQVIKMRRVAHSRNKHVYLKGNYTLMERKQN